MAANVQIDLRINDDAWNDWSGDLEALLQNVLECAARHTTPGHIDLLLTHDEDIRAINAEWRDKDKATDVLSFPVDEDPGNPDFLGDIAISHGVMTRDAEAMGKTLSAHLSHLLLHGYLHLLGFDHISDEEAEEMEALEIKILAELGIPDPYSDKQLN